MRIAIASGKGGTGKTTVATSLATVAARAGQRVQLLDCDVEEPNCHIFLKTYSPRSENITVPVPVVNASLCDGCGACCEICEFNALACVGTGVLTFTEMCHSCGGCWMVCPKEAITQGTRVLGVLEESTTGLFGFAEGRLRIGEAQAPPLIRKVKETVGNETLVFIDCPPGTSCPAIEAVKDADFVVLVTEPTPFGLNDLILAVETVRHLGLPFGVVVNRAGSGDDRVHRYCRDEGIDIFLDIPDDRRVAEAYSEGKTIVDAVTEMAGLYGNLLNDITSRCQGGVA